MSSAEIAQIPARILERARFSAKVRNLEHLAVIDDVANDVTAGALDVATARLRIKQFVASTGYQADESARGGLQDFLSTARTDLQVRMNVQLAQGAGWHQQGQDPAILDAFPAMEFVRVEARDEPRQDWPRRWNAARAATVLDGATDSSTGRMVALKGHPIWPELSRFGLPYEPFDYNSGKGTEDVSRQEAMDLDLIERDTVIFPDDRGFNADLQARPSARSERLRAAIEATGIGRFDAGGVLHYIDPDGGNN
ncbi:hypothetical protein [Actomonas aquatica]|uniref:Uncharacterized protein n=1 Tax=Actomonas aquatica TaxID=2866162 RepID=A0ABZ1CCV0_9BACT|nr:hypothetical protein [Opitutus sp. WL0086]WRQ89406.1 hypothetical protein K1X11_008290 [Opitutus sp. WL0086]